MVINKRVNHAGRYRYTGYTAGGGDRGDSVCVSAEMMCILHVTLINHVYD